eukprot:TRINITY_DN668_c0_g1_i1.p1 TRINITY_DN668_c0_g1~~TRINITY_DN668_c0_g1_i1.p1  ORF type:complete len:356 (-),score=114.96 TRINITY_DN668_c0_g1_i1:298-1365(-)
MGNSSGKKKKNRILEEWEKDTPKRIEIGDEILSTEKTYVESLALILEQFHDPMKNQKILKSSTIKTIFCNISTILDVHTNFLGQLEKACEVESRELGLVLMKQAPHLKHYTTYINNYNDAITALINSQNKKSSFNEFLAEKMNSEECNHLPLNAYLIMPVQRIPRYVLLFQDLLKHTDERHPDYNNCLTALDDIKEIADFVNEEKRLAEAMQDIYELQCSLSNLNTNLVERGRLYNSEGDLNVLGKKKAMKEIHYILFNDYIIFCVAAGSSSISLFNSNKKWKVIYHCYLLDLECNDLKDRHDRTNAIELEGKKKSYTVIFDSEEEKTSWLDEYFQIRARAPSKKKKKGLVGSIL